MIFLEILLGGSGLLLLMPTMVLFAEVLLAVTGKRGVTKEYGERRRLAVIVPAHDEASIIASTLRSIIPQLAASDRLIIVADNCSDETAAIASAKGAEVVVRTHLTLRGKGYALDFGIRHLERDPPDVVIVVDADCRVAVGSIDRLTRVCVRTGRPVQALYLMRTPKQSSMITRIAQFAWVVKNQVRPTGLHRLALPCQLMGTGMAFPWSCISTARLATGHIAEDLKLGIDLARAGTPPLFCPEALVTSVFPVSREGIRNQRARWEHGHLSVILSDGAHLLLESLVTLKARSLALALDLSVPPLALLIVQLVAMWLASAIFYILVGAKFPVAVVSTAFVLAVLSVLISWARYGRRIITFGNLTLAMLYILWKIPLYARFLTARQVDWIRSKRDDGDGNPPPA